MSAMTDFIHLLKSYASPITLSTLGFIVPSIFFFFSRLEDWNPRVRVNVDLARYVVYTSRGVSKEDQTISELKFTRAKSFFRIPRLEIMSFLKLSSSHILLSFLTWINFVILKRS